MFVKCIRQNFLISILPPDLLICQEGKTLTGQHIESAFYPHRSANQRISRSAFYPCPIIGLYYHTINYVAILHQISHCTFQWVHAYRLIYIHEIKVKSRLKEVERRTRTYWTEYIHTYSYTYAQNTLYLACCNEYDRLFSLCFLIVLSEQRPIVAYTPVVHQTDTGRAENKIKCLQNPRRQDFSPFKCVLKPVPYF